MKTPITGGDLKKYYLKDFKKTKHYLDKKRERSVTDYEVEKILNFGIPRHNDNGLTTYCWGPQNVTVCLNSYTLISVHPGDRPESLPKFIGKEESAKILEFKKRLEKDNEDSQKDAA